MDARNATIVVRDPIIHDLIFKMSIIANLWYYIRAIATSFEAVWLIGIVKNFFEYNNTESKTYKTNTESFLSSKSVYG